MKKNLRADGFSQWSRYWAGGALTSLPQDFAGNYDGEVAAFWHERFAETSPSSQLLDLCTGNGPIALLAAEWAEQHAHRLDITAVDAARPRPDRVSGLSSSQRALLQTIRFMGATPVESLPFEDESFDLVCSQYGIEYCDLQAAAVQVARVLRPGGVLAIVSHEADSAMMQTMRDELAAYDALEQSRLLKLMRSWGRGQLGDREFARAGQQALRALQAGRDAASRSPLVQQVGQAVAGLLQLPPAMMRQQADAVAQYADQLRAGRARLDDMLKVNRRIAEDPAWHAPFERAGLVPRFARALVYAGEHLMGRSLVWDKPA
ncbi:class I SAM-dependent methyltransferase [Wenzhouxiangella limi]|uniref:Methyltransferase domain-containing protein n=1 Tax=Wenzhouxiangella limi TaxID=2707351 RepID=A0A845UUR1_9GAMM|nr:class I SAM-dependent methyltransferase [Wenzhouxiangella limi]NDY95573.1 methyltransferase domain-containing protein [Wenzhouxiangella limi]